MSDLCIKIQTMLDRFKLELDFIARAGTTTAILGPSGSGKSSLLRVIAGLQAVSHGLIRYGDKTWLDTVHRRNLPTHKRSLVFTFQTPFLYPFLSIQENILFANQNHDSNSNEYRQVLTRTGIRRFLETKVKYLSGGEKQKVCLARSLLARGGVWLLDEPLSAIDTRSKNDILRFLQESTSGNASPVLYVTHNLNEALRLADRVILLENGQSTYQGNLENMSENLDLPFWKSQTPFVVITGQIIAQEPEHQLCIIDCKGLKLRIPEQEHFIGEKGLLKICALSVFISSSKKKSVDISCLNSFAGRVSHIRKIGSAFLLVSILVEGNLVFSQIHESLFSLNPLHTGEPVTVHLNQIQVLF